MSQTLSIGGLTLEPDAAWFQIDRYGILGGTHRINKVRNVWTIWGRVNGTTIAAVDAKVVALEAAIKDGIDVVFSLGSTMKMLSSLTIEGTHVKSFAWLTGFDGVRGSGAEGILRRTFKLVIQGDLLAITDTDITRWSETFTSIGSGGPKTAAAASLYGAVQAQQLKQFTPFWLLQSGTAYGLTEYPSPPLPQYFGVSGVFYDPETMTAARITPESWGYNQNLGFGIRWAYRCWSAFGLIGTPSPF